jgi:hypothetical protein
MATKSNTPAQKPVSEADKAEAERILEYVTDRDDLARKLMWRFAKKIPRGADRGSFLFDAYLIVSPLVAGDEETRPDPQAGPQAAMWRRFRHHFKTPGAKNGFFSRINAIANRYLGDIVYAYASSDLDGSSVQGPDLLWDETLLPLASAPSLLRQWTRDAAVTRRFLVALFKDFAEFATIGDPGRRASVAAQIAFNVGFDPTALTEELIKLGEINFRRSEDPEEEKRNIAQARGTVGRYISRLRDEVEKLSGQKNPTRLRRQPRDKATPAWNRIGKRRAKKSATFRQKNPPNRG